MNKTIYFFAFGIFILSIFGLKVFEDYTSGGSRIIQIENLQL